MRGPKGSARTRRALRRHLGRTAAAYGILVLALLLTGLAFYYVREDVEARERERFRETIQTTQRAVDRRMDTYVDAMYEGRGLFAASEFVTREEWSKYVAATDLQRRYPGIQAIGYAPRVSLEQKDQHLARVRSEGFPDYELVPPGERFEYFPITYVEPFEPPNRALLGQDFYSEPVSRSAMEQARDTGLPRASGRVDLSSGAGSADEPGFLVFTPVYRNGMPQGATAERRRALQGFIVGVFRADELLKGIFGDHATPRVDLEIFDGADYTTEQLLYDTGGGIEAGKPPEGSRLQDLETLDVAGRIWSLNFAALPGFEGGWRGNLPLFVLLSGLAISLMLFGVTWMLSTSRDAAEQVSLDLEAANTELAATNRALETANRELAAANQELKAFSYSVSHDLRTPLRSIEGFSQILLEDYAKDLDEEGRRHLARVRAAGEHMGHLIDDLLDLSRVTRSALRREPVDLSALATQIAAGLRDKEPERRVEFVISEGLRTTGDARLLRVALENLLGNAWKFTSRKESATIEFGVETSGGETAYFVRDDGAGFDMAYAGKLFGAFQRLHMTEEFEGTGIGLATVQRIVHRHGGRVWAEGEVGRGATFYFTLPG